MRIYRLEFGLSTVSGKVALCLPVCHAEKALCGCYIFELWCFYATWLGDECLLPCQDPSCECHFVDNPEGL